MTDESTHCLAVSGTEFCPRIRVSSDRVIDVTVKFGGIHRFKTSRCRHRSRVSTTLFDEIAKESLRLC